MYKAIVTNVYCDTHPNRVFYSGTGIAFSKSIDTATREANRLADIASNGAHFDWIGHVVQVRDAHTGKLIFSKL